MSFLLIRLKTILHTTYENVYKVTANQHVFHFFDAELEQFSIPLATFVIKIVYYYLIIIQASTQFFGTNQ